MFDLVPGARQALRVAAIGYLLWLAWKIAQAVPADAVETGAAEARPLTLTQAALFQWINPKAWAMALTALGAYAPGDDRAAVLMVAAVLGGCAIPSGATWILLGQQVRRWLTDPRWMRVFNHIMAGLLVLSVVPLLH